MYHRLFLPCLGVALLTLSGCLKAEMPPEVWKTCVTAEECVIVGTGCAVAAVRKDHQIEADAYYRHQNSMMDCEPRVDPATAGVQCGHQDIPCRDMWGRIDHVSTCTTAHTVCQVVPSPVPGSAGP